MTIPDAIPATRKTAQKPKKPRADFPLFPAGNGQWTKKVKAVPYRFGSWRDDPKGERAMDEWLRHKDSILAGRGKVPAPVEGLTVGDLMKAFLEDRRAKMLRGDLSKVHYGNYADELPRFTGAVGLHIAVEAMTPANFAPYVKLMDQRKLGAHARKRVIALVKAMFHFGAKEGLHKRVEWGQAMEAPDTSPAAITRAKMRQGKADNGKRIATGEELDKLLRVASRQYRAILLLGVNLGMGPADIGRLRWRHINFATGLLDMPRGKTGAERRGYLWKKTQKALRRVRALPYNQKAIARGDTDSLIFLSLRGTPMYRETEIIKDGASVGVRIANPISQTFGDIANRAGVSGLTFYRLRHTCKTLGKAAHDRDALNLVMGHIEPGIGKVYDHESIGLDRLKKVALAIKRGLWPKPVKRPAGSNPQSSGALPHDAAAA